MSDYTCHIEGCDWSGDSPTSLRSHVSGVKDNDHQEARNNRAWEGWYPEAFGVVDPSEGEGSNGSTDDPDVGTNADPSEPTDGDKDSTPDDEGPDPTEEYEEQWGSDGGDGDNSADPDEPTDDGSNDPQQDGVGAAMSLVAGSLVVGLLYVLTSEDEGSREVRDIESEEVEPSDGNGETQSVEDGDVWGETFE